MSQIASDPELVDALFLLADRMQVIAGALRELGHPLHADQMSGAAIVARQWSEDLQGEINQRIAAE